MKREYTPGPWEVLQDGPEAGNIPDMDIFADGYKIATVVAGDALLNGPDSDQNQPGDYEEALAELNANAALIAAAPKLAETLEDIRCWLTCPDLSPGTIEAYRHDCDIALALLKPNHKTAIHT